MSSPADPRRAREDAAPLLRLVATAGEVVAVAGVLLGLWLRWQGIPGAVPVLAAAVAAGVVSLGLRFVPGVAPDRTR